ncbi:MAG: hypothetical protein Q8920_09580 [Bacillota bacterium]|nr:hypothetical protein [Bacillota bacterium]
MIALLVIGFGAVALIQIPGLVRKRWWRELITFTVLLLAGFILSVVILVGVKIPPISTIINKFITGVFGI